MQDPKLDSFTCDFAECNVTAGYKYHFLRHMTEDHYGVYPVARGSAPLFIFGLLFFDPIISIETLAGILSFARAWLPMGYFSCGKKGEKVGR